VTLTTEHAAGSQHDEITCRLLDAAVAAFVEHGIDNAGVAAIARAAGVTTGAIYSRWSGKHEMMIAALDRVMSAELGDALLARPDISAPDLLASLGSDLVAARDPAADHLLMEALALARRDTDFGAMLSRIFDQQEARLAEVINEGKSAGTIAADLDTEALVSLCHSISLGFVMFGAIDRPLPMEGEWNLVVQRMVTAALPLMKITTDTPTTGAK